MDTAAQYSFVPLILNIAVKNETGLDIHELYRRSLDELEAALDRSAG